MAVYGASDLKNVIFDKESLHGILMHLIGTFTGREETRVTLCSLTINFKQMETSTRLQTPSLCLQYSFYR